MEKKEGLELIKGTGLILDADKMIDCEYCRAAAFLDEDDDDEIKEFVENHKDCLHLRKDADRTEWAVRGSDITTLKEEAVCSCPNNGMAIQIAFEHNERYGYGGIPENKSY